MRDVEVAVARAMTAWGWLTELHRTDEVAALPSPVGKELVDGSAALPDDYRVVKASPKGRRSCRKPWRRPTTRTAMALLDGWALERIPSMEYDWEATNRVLVN